jgi:hypothetical protein
MVTGQRQQQQQQFQCQWTQQRQPLLCSQEHILLLE